MKTSTHESTHVSADHLVKFYETLDAFRNNYYDGFVVTGAPVEHLAFEQVDYWDEFEAILDWAGSHVFSTMYLCWGRDGRAQPPVWRAQARPADQAVRRVPAVSAG